MFLFVWWHTWIWSSEYRCCLGMSSTMETICFKVSKKTCCIYICIFASFIHIFNHFCQLSVSFIKINSFLILSKSLIILLLTYLTSIDSMYMYTHTHTLTHSFATWLMNFPYVQGRTQSYFPGCLAVKNSSANAGDKGSIPALGRSLGKGNDNPLQGSCMGNPMNRWAWQATVHGVTKSQTRLSD